MSEPNDGGSAFPVELSETLVVEMVKSGVLTASECARIKRGMSLRDWFAGMALQGILASDAAMTLGADRAAEWSFQHADALIKARLQSIADKEKEGV